MVTGLTAGSASIRAISEGISGSATIMAHVVSFATVSAGDGWHSCAVTSIGAAYCWGWGGDGELGNGFRPIGAPPLVAPLAAAETPLAVAGTLTFVSVSPGLFHTCGVTPTGDAYCWGDNSSGQLGDGSTTSSLVPVPVTGGHQFASVSLGYFHSCGVTTANGVYCWGDNLTGQLGVGSASGNASLPLLVAAGLRFQTVREGFYDTCGVTTTNAAYCWGWNQDGQVGNGTTAVAVTSPTAVGGGHSFVTVAPGARHSCGIAPDGTAYCWGDGQLTPVQVAGGPFATADASLAAGTFHTCALAPTGAAFCWGNNSVGQLGDGSTIDRSTPVPVSGGLRFATISAGGYHTCGVTTASVALCWGANGNGQLGVDAPATCVDADGRPVSCATAPVQVIGQPGAAAAKSHWVDARWQVPSVLRGSSRLGSLPPLPSIRAP